MSIVKTAPFTRLSQVLPLLTLCALAQIVQADPPDPKIARDNRWLQDLNFYETELPAKHLDFYKLMPKEKFEREMEDIKNSVPQLSGAEITLRLARLTAGLGVAHTRIDLQQLYPLWFQWYSDGLGVIATVPEYREALGARVVRIGTMTPEELEAAVAPYISHENKSWLREESPRVMMVPDLLKYLKIADAKGGVELTLVEADGKPFTMQISPPTGLITPADVLNTATSATPLYRKNPEAFYWYDYLPGWQMLYIQYNDCENDPKKPFTDFARELFAFADSHPVQRTVVDLRLNHGGDDGVIKPLLEGIQSRPALNAKGHLFVLIGPGTMSSGEEAAEIFHNSFPFIESSSAQFFNPFTWRWQNFWQSTGPDFNATLVGEPTGGKPNTYGEIKSFSLPNSKLQVWYSTKYFQFTKEDDPPSRVPDITVTHSWEDYLAGRDPVLDAALGSSSP